MELKILAKSSSQPEPYSVVVKWSNNKLSALCSCPAGEIGQLCKHKYAVLSNDQAILYDKKQSGQLDKISEWVQASSFPSLLSELEQAEEEKDEAIEKAKKKYSTVKHKIARLLSEGV